MRKIAMLLAVVLLAAGIVYATYATGDPEALAEVSDQVQGALIGVAEGGKSVAILTQEAERTYPLAANAWVYKDNRKASFADLQPGDRVELILNSKQQAAYIKATGQEPPPAAGADSKELAGSVHGEKPTSDARPPESGAHSLENGAQSSENGAQSPGAAEPSTGPALPAASKPGGGITEPADAADEPAGLAEWPWAEFSLEVKSRELQLKAKHKPGKGGKESEADIYVQMKDRTVIHLKDGEAEQWLQLLLQDQPTGNGKAWEEALKRQIVANLQLEDASPDVKLKVKRNGGNGGNSGNSGKDNGKSSENSKSSGKNRGDDQDDDRDDEDD